MLSPAFRVRDFNVQDVTSYPIQLTWDSVGGEDSGLVFIAGLVCSQFQGVALNGPFELLPEKAA